MPPARRSRSGDDSLREFVLDQLSALGGIHGRAMFGGHGFYLDGEFFAILWRGRLYFRTTEASRAKYLAAGMEPFRPGARQTLSTYMEVPAAVLEDSRELGRWAREAAGARPAGAAHRRAGRGR